MMANNDLQMRVLRIYTALRVMRPQWGGVLLLSCGLDAPGLAVAMAANIAGAVCLSLEEDLELLRAAMRSGCCDFIVNTLDEALRTMKNEVRQHQPISVGLGGAMVNHLRECLERGVQPQVILDMEDKGDPVSFAQFRQFGASLVGLSEIDACVHEFTKQRGWHLWRVPAKDAMALRAFDAHALEHMKDDPLRSSWLRAVSRIVQRQRPFHRALWVTAEERQRLETAG